MSLRRSPLAPSQTPLRRARGIPRQSPKRERLSVQRRTFVREFLAEHPVCMVEIEVRDCYNPSVEVHESLRRSAGGEIIPGPKADAQGQTFWAVCRPCHRALTNPIGRQLEWAMEQGYIQSRFKGEVA